MKKKHSQHGATLITALVMLVVLTLLVLSAIRSSTINLRIVGNMQFQEEAVAAAQQATEQLISSSYFTVAPAASSVSIDINKDGTTDYTANIAAPVCTGSTPMTNNTPNLPSECISSGQAQNTGIIFASGVPNTGVSWCYAQQWDVQTGVSDSRSGASSTMHQGVSLNVPVGTDC